MQLLVLTQMTHCFQWLPKVCLPLTIFPSVSGFLLSLKKRVSWIPFDYILVLFSIVLPQFISVKLVLCVSKFWTKSLLQPTSSLPHLLMTQTRTRLRSLHFHRFSATSMVFCFITVIPWLAFFSSRLSMPSTRLRIYIFNHLPRYSRCHVFICSKKLVIIRDISVIW